jgi:hypothetical protein
MNLKNMRAVISSALLILMTVIALRVEASDVTLQVGITGSNNLEGLEDPVSVAKIPEVSRLFQDIADQPRTAEYVQQALENSNVNLDRLLDLGLIRAWDGAYAINFNYLTLEDHVTLVTTLVPYAESLAQAYRDRWNEFEAVFTEYDAPGVSASEVAFVVVGAMSLDWDGLDITAEKDLRITAKNLPEGRDFVIWAKERSTENNVKELYWGSHNEVVNGVRFTTFGDHHTFPRLAFPDLLWNTSSRVADIDGASRQLRIGVYKALKPYYQNDFLSDVGPILRVLRQGPYTGDSIAETTGIEKDRADAILLLLKELQYVEEADSSYLLSTPFFSHHDKPMIDAARSLSWQLMNNWLDVNYSSVEASLGELTAIKYGVPYKQLYTEIWHYIFGLANKALVQSGHFANPYVEERLSKAIIPFAFDTEVLGVRTEARIGD